MATKPRVKVPQQVKKGEVFEVKTLISHKMETGLRKDRKTGELIPRKIINKLVVKYNGKEVFRADFHPAIAANPYMSFFTKATKSGNMEFTWVDDDGKEYKHTAKINVN